MALRRRWPSAFQNHIYMSPIMPRPSWNSWDVVHWVPLTPVTPCSSDTPGNGIAADLWRQVSLHRFVNGSNTQHQWKRHRDVLLNSRDYNSKYHCRRIVPSNPLLMVQLQAFGVKIDFCICYSWSRLPPETFRHGHRLTGITLNTLKHEKAIFLASFSKDAGAGDKHRTFFQEENVPHVQETWVTSASINRFRTVFYRRPDVGALFTISCLLIFTCSEVMIFWSPEKEALNEPKKINA